MGWGAIGAMPDGVANAPGPPRDRLRDQLLARLLPAEQIALGRKAGLDEQPFHRIGLRLEPAIGEDVRNLHPAFFERARDEQGPVAVEGLLLGAHERDAMLRRAAHHPRITRARPARKRSVRASRS